MNHLKRIREELLLSRAELARKAGVSPLTIQRVEEGQPCRLDTKRKIIEALKHASPINHMEDVVVPPYLPDCEEVRSDLLDYAVEIEWGDCEVGRALEVLEATGELDEAQMAAWIRQAAALPGWGKS